LFDWASRLKNQVSIGLLSITLLMSCHQKDITPTSSSVLFFDGELNDANVDAALKKLAPGGTISTIRIRSGGGYPKPANRLAGAIMRFGLAVEVEDFCLSACMSFVFPAAKTRAVSDNAILGFHYADSYDVAVLAPMFGRDSIKLQSITDSLSRQVLRYSRISEQLLIEQGEKLEPLCWTNLSSKQAEKVMVYRYGIWLPSKVSLEAKNLTFAGNLFADNIEAGEVRPVTRKLISDRLGIPDPAKLPPMVAGGLPEMSPVGEILPPRKCDDTIVRQVIH
jgi:hypothetical protein